MVMVLESSMTWLGLGRDGGRTYFLESSFAPFDHSLSSSLAFFASWTAALPAAASAFLALPAAFLVFSPFVLGAMVV